MKVFLRNAGFFFSRSGSLCVLGCLLFGILSVRADPRHVKDCTAACDPVRFIEMRAEAGAKQITVPPGNYLLHPKDGMPCLRLEGLNNMTIDFKGSKFIGAIRTRMIDLSSCTNVTLKNLTIDYAELPFTQGVITEIDADKTWTVETIDGYPAVAPEKNGDGSAWPIQAYDAATFELSNPMRFRDGIAIEKTGDRTFRVSGGLDRSGKVGDIAVWSVREQKQRVLVHAVEARECVQITYENIVIYSTPHGVAFNELLCERTTYLNCRLERCPPSDDLQPRGLKRLRSGNHDAYMSRGAVVGPQIIGCSASYHCDDCVNIGGKYAVVMESVGRDVRVVSDGLGSHLDPGFPAQVMTYRGTCLPDVKIVSVRPDRPTTPDEFAFLKGQRMWPGVPATCRLGLRVTLDREIILPKGSLLISSRHTGNGFLVKNCRFGHNRSRGMIIQASDGCVEGNVIERTHDLGIKMSMNYIWLEGSCGKNVVFRNNRIVKQGRGTAIWLGGTPGEKGGCLQADSHRDITFVGNVIRGVSVGIDVIGCSNLTLDGNDIVTTDGKAESAVRLKNTENVVWRPVRKN